MTTDQQHTWPEFFPRGCPPEPHSCAPGTYIRLVSMKPIPPDADFFPQIVDQSGVTKGEGRGSVCRSCALSVFDSPNAARNFLDNDQEFLFRQLARMEVSGDDGVIRPYETVAPGHHLWWIPDSGGDRSYRRFFRGCVDAT